MQQFLHLAWYARQGNDGVLFSFYDEHRGGTDRVLYGNGPNGEIGLATIVLSRRAAKALKALFDLLP